MTDLTEITLARPFAKDRADDAQWNDADRDRAVDDLLSAVQRREHALVVGEPGVGKTVVVRALKNRLPAHYRTTYVAHVTLGRRDFTRQVCVAMGVAPKGTPAALFEAVQRDVAQQAGDNRVHSVLVLDEAHLMPDTTLAHLHVLANFAWDSRPLLSLVLVGLPELHDRLRLSIHRSLLTRLSCKVELAAPSPEQTTHYVRARLQHAGVAHELFTPDGMAVLHELTGGLLRSVDVVADAALRLAARDGERLVDRGLVRRAWQGTPLH